MRECKQMNGETKQGTNLWLGSKVRVASSRECIDKTQRGSARRTVFFSLHRKMKSVLSDDSIRSLRASYGKSSKLIRGDMYLRFHQWMHRPSVLALWQSFINDSSLYSYFSWKEMSEDGLFQGRALESMTARLEKRNRIKRRGFRSATVFALFCFF